MPRELRPECISHLVLHCSDSAWGDDRVINDWHRQRGFDYAGGTYAGYHYIVLNGFKTYALFKDGIRESEHDGTVQEARPVCWWGCHAPPLNGCSLGICLIGVRDFTPKQFEALTRLVFALMDRYSIPVDHVIGHYETSMAGGKTCPNFDVPAFRRTLAERIAP